MQLARIKDYLVYFQNSPEFHQLKREIFGSHSYYYEFESPVPRIIDAGAHLGLSTLYFKMLTPKAQITAIEPNPYIVPLFEQNIFENQLENITLLPIALSDKQGEEILYLDETKDQWYSTASFQKGAWTGDQKTTQVKVPSVSLASLLTEPVDLLKMDIEGAEERVLLAAKDDIQQIKHLFVEYHPVEGNSLEKIALFLEENRFNITLWKKGKEIPLNRVEGLCIIEADRKS